MDECKRVYKVNGNDYLDIKASSKETGICYSSLSGLMKGIEFASSHKIDFKRVGSKILVKKDDLRVIKSAFAV